MSAADAQLRTLSPGVVRTLALVVCFTALPGLIISSIADNTNAALAFGFAMASGALVLIVVAAINPGRASVDAGEALEAQIEALVAGGADESAVRNLVRQAIRFGETRS